MSEEMIVRHCSPTLAGLKTANMFTCRYRDEDELRGDLRRLNASFGKKGLRAIPLRAEAGSALVYIYRPKKLEKDLGSPISNAILSEQGYGEGTASSRLSELIRRLRKNEGFPHEIGLFLGYPPDDVRCFICDRNRDCKCVGCWRAYNNEKQAEKTFALFKKCTDVYCRLYSQGSSLERLTVAV